MDPSSPPKRVTRARAAAKTSSDSTIKIATAAAKAKASLTTAKKAAPAPTKRKTRADDVEEDSDSNNEADRVMITPTIQPKPRGRPRRTAEVKEEEDAPPVAKVARGRVRKVVETPATVSDPAPLLTRATRGRPATKKAPVEEVQEEEQEATIVVVENAKRTRGRPAGGAAAGTSKPKASGPVKKVVKFQDQEDAEKENIIPITKAGGLKAKPVRKPATTRGRVAKTPVVKDERVLPLSPKKATQITTATSSMKDSCSEDELATMEKTPMRTLVKNTPLKPELTTSVFGNTTAKKLDFTTSIIANRAVTQDLGASIMASPARRMPQSPYKDAFKGSPKRVQLGDSTPPKLTKFTPADSVFKTSLMQSPARRAASPFKVSAAKSTEGAKMQASFLHSPAKRITSPVRVSASGSPEPMPKSTFKTSLLQSPAKRLAFPAKISAGGSPEAASKPVFNASLLQSPAKRPASPAKVTSKPTSPPKSNISSGPVVPGTVSFARLGTPKTSTKALVRPGRLQFSSAPRLARDNEAGKSKVDFMNIKPFPGRMSAVLPRSADPVMREETVVAPIPTEDLMEEEAYDLDINVDEPMDMDTEMTEQVPEEDEEIRSTTPTQSPPRHSTGNFGLRQEDQDPYQDYESEDELASSSPSYTPAPLGTFNISTIDFATSPSTPTPIMGAATITAETSTRNESPSGTRSATRDWSVKPGRGDIGFTPLARQLSDWMAASPDKSDVQQMASTSEIWEQVYAKPDAQHESPSRNMEQVNPGNDHPVQTTPAATTFFEDEMLIRDDPVVEEESIEDILTTFKGGLTVEDLDLAAEAEEMSLLVTDEWEQPADNLDPALSFEALSENSQEYGDENAFPIDPTLLPSPTQLPVIASPVMVTPARVLRERVFHTVSKVPLKPEATESPVKYSPMKRSASASKLTSQRHAPPPPTRSEAKDVLGEMSLQQSTPASSKNWSTATPSRTPRRDLDNQVLKGAVVFVDVHTTEGADASAVFVDLLGQMGARCVKSWHWSPNSSLSDSSPETDGASSNSKVGITHVVFKDGGKRTLEKVRESKGVVLCVGVSWVLDCERNNSWVDESPYTIDTGLVPRGGHRRRKSMEPRALAKMNGCLVSTPGRDTNMSPTKEFLNIADTPSSSLKINRRASTAWVRSPQSDENDDDIVGLSPVPATPAPETVSAYVDGIMNADEMAGESETPYFMRAEQLVQMTAPPKQNSNGGYGELGQAGGEGSSRALMQRLMLARRKSLQWAPKVGSPLARGASYGL